MYTGSDEGVGTHVTQAHLVWKVSIGYDMMFQDAYKHLLWREQCHCLLVPYTSTLCLLSIAQYMR